MRGMKVWKGVARVRGHRVVSTQVRRGPGVATTQGMERDRPPSWQHRLIGRSASSHEEDE